MLVKFCEENTPCPAASRPAEQRAEEKTKREAAAKKECSLSLARQEQLLFFAVGDWEP